ncbi:MAG: sigma-70 family RNA polymerase sigma factor [Chitinivibrionales bacterium]|nr:sigma-70 family RNA polymerase sigma factor [Chitinivibrionales bacterium]
MNPVQNDENAVKRALSHLTKLAELQGFVTPAQVEKAAADDDLRESVEAALDDAGISINTLVQDREKRRREGQGRRYWVARRSPRYADPTWVYLNSVGRVPLLTRNEEIEYAKQMEDAQNKLYELAFSARESYETLYLIADRLKRGEVEVLDILRVEDDDIEDPETAEALKAGFTKNISRVRRKDTQAEHITEDLKKTTSKTARAQAREKLLLLRKECVSLCMQLGLNGKQVQGILEKFRAHLEESGTPKQLGEFHHWEHVRDSAKCAIIEANVRLVVSIAKRHTLRGMEIIDLIQEGNRGLIKAVENFDYRKGYRFSTYATWWIRQAISRAINDKSKAIRIPANTQDLVNRTLRLCKRWVLEYGYEPTAEEIAKELNCPISKVQLALEYSMDPISLDMEVGRDGGATVGEYIEDTKAENPAERLSLVHLREQIQQVLDSLADKEREILTMRFGLDDGRVKTLKEIGEIFNISRERVRQIETKALSKLKHPSRTKLLQAWKDDRHEFMHDE